jgi:hypothetical protein
MCYKNFISQLSYTLLCLAVFVLFQNTDQKKQNEYIIIIIIVTRLYCIITYMYTVLCL